MSVRYHDGEEEEEEGDRYEEEETETFEGENAMRGYDPDGIQVKAEPDPDEEEDEFAGQPNIKDWKPDVDVTFKGTSLSFFFPTSPSTSSLSCFSRVCTHRADSDGPLHFKVSAHHPSNSS